MHMLRWFGSLLMLAFLLPVLAQPNTPGTWETMLYDRNQGAVYTINSNGDGQQLQLPAPPTAADPIPRHVAVSRDGVKLAYMTYETALGNGPLVATEPVNGTLNIYNRETEQNDTYPFQGINHHMLDYPASPEVFGPDGNELALGYHQPGGWFIAILNTDTRRYTDKLLSSQQITLTGAASLYERPLPVVTRYDGRDVEFVVVPAQTAPTDITALNSYVWNTQTDDVQPTARFFTTEYDLFGPTGEVIEATVDATYPTNPAFDFGHRNVLAVATAYDQRQPFYASSRFLLSRPVFVRNGEQVMFQAISADGDSTWTVIPRDGGPASVVFGSVGGQPLDVHDIAGTEFGVLVAADSQQIAGRIGLQQLPGTSIVYIDLRDGSTLELEPITSIQAVRLEFIWTDYMLTAPATPYRDWASAAPDSITTAPTNTPPAQLQVGDMAQVFTTEGDTLNIRSGPATNFNIVDRVESGEMVTLLEGPVAADGLNWWRVRTPSEVEGWTVEQADNVRTLQPVSGSQPIPTAPPDGIFLGGEAVVTVGPGGAANMRQDPSTATRVLLILSDRARVDIIGGPVQAEGYTWWQVQTNNGTIGWMVEAVNGDTVLEPIR